MDQIEGIKPSLKDVVHFAITTVLTDPKDPEIAESQLHKLRPLVKQASKDIHKKDGEIEVLAQEQLEVVDELKKQLVLQPLPEVESPALMEVKKQLRELLQIGPSDQMEIIKELRHQNAKLQEEKLELARNAAEKIQQLEADIAEVTGVRDKALMIGLKSSTIDKKAIEELGFLAPLPVFMAVNKKRFAMTEDVADITRKRLKKLKAK